MKLLNVIYSNQEAYRDFLIANSVDLNLELFIQIFAQILDKDVLKSIIKEIREVTPNAKIILSSTANSICADTIDKTGVALGISIFEKSRVKTAHFDNNDYMLVADRVSRELISEKTKLLIIFAETYSTKMSIFFNKLHKNNKNILVAGGKAGDGFKFEQTLVGTQDGVYESGIVCASIDSDELVVYNGHSFAFQPVGQEMRVTRYDNGIIYEINNQKAVDVYRYYLGDEVADNLPVSGIEFPLIYEADGEMMGMAPVGVTKDGGVVCEDVLREGMIVRFSYGDVDTIHHERAWNIASIPCFTEAIYTYSCAGRFTYLGEHDILKEVRAFNEIAPICGFFTYGEFYTLKSKFTTTNLTATFVVLSEDQTKFNIIKNSITPNASTEQSRVLKGLTRLIKVTSSKLEDAINISSQYKDLIETL